MSGGACSAYRCQVQDGWLHVAAHSTLRSECVSVPDAVQRLARGEVVVVAGSDMATLRTQLAGHGIGQAGR